MSATVLVGQDEIPGCWGTHGDNVLIGDVLGNGGYLAKKEFVASPGI
jgi:hypothetical protein